MKDFDKRILFILGVVVLAVAARLIPHPSNFTPAGAVALFAGASIANRWLALLVPMSVMFVSDLWLGTHVTLPFVYACLMFNVLLGCWAGNQLKLTRLIPASLLGAVVFFLVTNFGSWLAYYDRSWQGLVECYVAAIPFFGNSLAGDAVFGGMLFGALCLAESFVPDIRPARSSVGELQTAGA